MLVGNVQMRGTLSLICTVWSVSAGYLNLKGEKNRPNKHDALRAFACLIDYMHFFDEHTTVNGTVIIFDSKHYTVKMETYISLEERKDFTYTWQVWTRLIFSFYRAALNAGRSSYEKAVCLSVRQSVRRSVCLSNAWIVTKQKKDLSRFLYHTKDHLA